MDKRQLVHMVHEHRHHIGIGLILAVERFFKLLELALELAAGILRLLWNKLRKPKEAPPK